MSEIVQGTSVERTYEVESAIVTLTIIIGEGQIGASAVFLDQQLIGKGDLGVVTLGPGPVLTGRTLGIRSIVSDINPSTNRTAVTYMLSGGASELDITLTEDAPSDQASVAYAGIFHLAQGGAS